MSQTAPARMASALLENQIGTTLADFLTDKRREGHSYERIAQEIYRITDGTVAVTRETIRNWINDLEAVA